MSEKRARRVETNLLVDAPPHPRAMGRRFSSAARRAMLPTSALCNANLRLPIPATATAGGVRPVHGLPTGGDKKRRRLNKTRLLLVVCGVPPAPGPACVGRRAGCAGGGGEAIYHGDGGESGGDCTPEVPVIDA